MFLVFEMYDRKYLVFLRIEWNYEKVVWNIDNCCILFKFIVKSLVICENE